MNIRKAIGSLLGALALGVLAATPSQAQQVTFASATGTGAGASTVFTYSGGSTGTFRTSAGSQFFGLFLPTSAFTAPATLTFTGFSATGTTVGTGSAADPFRQGLSGGTFSLTDSSSTNLLSGSFTGGDIVEAINGSSTASITNSVNNVTYTGGTYFASSGLVNPGSFSISMTSLNPVASVSGGYLNAFTAGGTSTFSATQPTSTVPEPASVATFALGGLGLLALVVRARKNRGVSGLAA